MTYLVAFYELSQSYGGPEEGGWWYETGELVRVARTFPTEDRAAVAARKANRLLDRLQRRKRPVYSMAYTGGRHRACVYENIAPASFPAERPCYS